MSIHSTLEDLKQKCIHQNCKTMASKLVKLLPLASRSITLGPRNALLNFTLRRNYLPRRYDPFDGKSMYLILRKLTFSQFTS